MSNLKLFPFNLVVQDETVIAPSSENSLFPASNLKDPRTTKVHRTETGTLSNVIVFDMITIEDVDAVMTVPSFKTGFTGISSDITIEANPTDSWGAPDLTATLTPNDEFKFGFKVWSAVQQYRFWRISFSNSQDYAEISKVFIGVDAMRSVTDNNVDFGWSKKKKDMSKFRRNRYQQRFTDKIGDIDIYRFTYSLLSKDEHDALVDALDEVGETIPFWMIVDSDATIVNDAERFAGVFYLTGKPPVSNPHFGLYSLSFTAEGAM